MGDISSEDIERLQQHVISNYEGLKDHQDVVKGEFKRIIPLGDGRAVAVMTQQVADESLKRECQYLQSLEKNGVPALKTYGEVFHVGKEQHPAVIVDWIPNATLVDVKHPDAMRAIVPAMLLGVKVGKGEGGLAFALNNIKKAISDINPDSHSLEKIKERAQELAKAFTELDFQIKSGKLQIIDLQVLVGEDNKLTIIDPQEVLNSEYRDVLNPSNKVDIAHNPDLLEFINNSRTLLQNYAQMLNAVAKANNIEELKKALSAEPVKKAAAKGGNPLLRKAVEGATANRALEGGRPQSAPLARRSPLVMSPAARMSQGAAELTQEGRPKSAPAVLQTTDRTNKTNASDENTPRKKGPSK
ncbi:MAG: hypothetical protein AB7I18_05125 [Candidatus Berkiella sp.]